MVKISISLNGFNDKQFIKKNLLNKCMHFFIIYDFFKLYIFLFISVGRGWGGLL